MRAATRWMESEMGGKGKRDITDTVARETIGRGCEEAQTLGDLATYAPPTDVTTVANHRIFDAYGNLTAETAPAMSTLFAYTSRPFDPATGLQNNLNRWYDPSVGKWISEDPIGFGADDANVRRYVLNSPLVEVDPTGLDVDFTFRRPVRDAASIDPTLDRTNSVGSHWGIIGLATARKDSVVQRVVSNGTFTITACVWKKDASPEVMEVETHEYAVSWEESFVEVWVRGTTTPFDHHLATPNEPSKYLERRFNFDLFRKEREGVLRFRDKSAPNSDIGTEGNGVVLAWHFSMSTTFTAVNGTYGCGEGEYKSECNVALKQVTLDGQKVDSGYPGNFQFYPILWPGHTLKKDLEYEKADRYGAEVQSVETWTMDWSHGEKRPRVTYPDTANGRPEYKRLAPKP